jgi:hypothetical protein
MSYRTGGATSRRTASSAFGCSPALRLLGGSGEGFATEQAILMNRRAVDKTPTSYYVSEDGGLRVYAYDPANPVPTVGGNNTRRWAGTDRKGQGVQVVVICGIRR